MTLPLHHHDHSQANNNTGICSHDNHADETHHANTNEEDCAICFNLFTANAVIQINDITQSIVVINLLPIINDHKPSIWHNISLNNSTNKDPPLSIIS